MDDPVGELVLATFGMNKQVLVFVSTKNSAEAQAERIAKLVNSSDVSLKILCNKLLKAMPKPTSQCERLARCAAKGVAFHHAGLHGKQKELVEDAFREGKIKAICCTPTLAMGVSLPAFRAIIRDLRRFGPHGSDYIPVLEYHQMSGRAGRPEYDSFGEAITIAATEPERDMIVEKYHNGAPEEITSKLAVEPVLRTYLLALISARVVSSRKSIMDFFGRTFWAFQYENMRELEDIIDDMLLMLVQFGFLKIDDEKYVASFLGRRVAELYLDPLSAHTMLLGLERSKDVPLSSLVISHMLCCCLEMRPLLSVRQKEYDLMADHAAKIKPLVKEPGMFEPEYEDWLNALKTALLFEDWVGEADDEQILETYNSRPGETRAKIEKADWLLYCVCELARIVDIPQGEFRKLRLRLKYGVKEELLPLVKLRNIGRVRARKLFRAGIKTAAEVLNAPDSALNSILGPGVARKIKENSELKSNG